MDDTGLETLIATLARIAKDASDQDLRPEVVVIGSKYYSELMKRGLFEFRERGYYIFDLYVEKDSHNPEALHLPHEREPVNDNFMSWR